MEFFHRSPMKLLLFAAWFSSVLDPCRFDDICRSCHKNASCMLNDESKNACFCKQGFTGDGINNCQDDNECENVTGICGPNATCTNNVGNYHCTCLSGFTANGKQEFQTNDGTYCKDIDECMDAGRCGPFSKCHNTNGSFICSCMRGYTSPAGPWFKPKNGTDCRGENENPKKHCHRDHRCIKDAVSNTLEKMINLSTSERLKEIRHQTSADLSPVLLMSYIEAMASPGDESQHPEEHINETIMNLVFSVNNLVEKDEKVEWDKINEDLRKYYVTTLLHTAEKETLALSAGYTHTTQLQVDAGEVEMKLYTFEPHQAHTQPVSTNIQGNSISLTPKNSKEKNNTGSTSIVFLIYNNIGDLLKPADDPGVADYSRYAAAGEITVNSPVIAAAISNPKTFALNNVTFTLKHTQEIDPTLDETKCAFWEYSQSMMGHWSLDGCTRTHVNATHTLCSCNHLTHFAILMSSAQANLLAHYNVLTRITQLGMVISIICLSMCIFTFWFFRDIQNTRTTIHKNLCCSLFMAQFIFLIGINKIAHKWFCSLIAGLLHYFFLAAFAWMCIEGIHLYLIVVGVIYNKGFLHRNFYLFGYGSPAVVVAISATLGHKYYGTSTVCWLSTEHNFVWSFIGPACLIILVNLLAFAVIIFKVYRHTAVKIPEISHYENIRSCARGAIALLFVLGVTWTFGVMHILYETTLTAYLFTFANVFQGMFIFIFLCVLSRRIQEEYYRLFKNVPCCFECLR
ncbi:adhesion G protein-coupled receptor L4-like isoform X2 [Sinocyclocheilus grahami]|uniref:adhesion G protein-coupled receptor L4-like isoform X1 n=1 Tax=Sinocyclocheilus grahami TaxID=75366 RepID=UPI0007AC9273|nr:PREDICTED: adhesion G protein-coupled receptor L4-like isoform X1 [Sinocyclocheilus grahami]XP_016094728.1 PREDICTED: adhesion G protein-coupled receptor L4-like isoform X2 [Sinocyclocheilus grahami]